MSSLYEKLGGEGAVDAAVDIFYRKVLQKAFLTFAFGGPNNYSGLDMKKGHEHLVKRGLNDSHVDAVIELLGGTLKELGVADDLIGEVAGIAESVRGQVLGRD